MCGPKNKTPSPIEEVETLTSLKRGIYLKSSIKKGTILTEDDIYFAMPVQDNQLISSKWQNGIVANKDYKTNEPLDKSACLNMFTSSDEQIYQIMLQKKLYFCIESE